MQNIRTLYARLVTSSLDWSAAVKSGNRLAPLFLRTVVLVAGTLSVSRVKIIFGFSKTVYRLHKHLGSKGLAMYLKTCFVLLQQAIGGMIDTAPWKIGMNVARTRRGIPRIIDRRDRQLINLGDVTIIRLWLTLFGLYRVLDFRGKLKLSTITSPGLDLSSNGVLEMWRKWLPIFIHKASIETRLPWKIRLDRELSPYRIPLIRKKSPNSGGLAAVAALPLDIVRWCLEPKDMMISFSRYLQEVDGLELVWGLKPFIKSVQEYVEEKRELFAQCVRMNPFTANPWVKDPQRSHHGPFEPETKTVRVVSTIAPLNETWGPVTALGALGFKHEPGKIRVFAMVDVLTQALMEPLHRWLFSRLKGIGQDGTFNQYSPLENLIKRMDDPSKTWIASYDLSAATDRLPLSLQVMILEMLGSVAFAKHWGNLLVGRAYRLPKEAKSWNLGFSEVRYAVGQPMGALSSWAMLATTHHAIVQLAAARALREYKLEGWFQDYAVLGDDVVIANKAVAMEYLSLMNLIGVEIGLAKSLVSSQGTFEFAKRTYYKGQDVSPISLAEAVVSLRNIASLMELVKKNLKFERIRVSSVARFAGFGYRNLGQLQQIWKVGNRLGRLSAFLHQPGGVWPSSLAVWLTAVGPGGAPIESFGEWRVATHLWKTLVSRAIEFGTRVERLLPHIDLYSYTFGEDRKLQQNEVKQLREALKAGVNPEYKKDGSVKFLEWDFRSEEHFKKLTCSVQAYLQDGKPLAKVMRNQAFNDFFSEWVTRPYHKDIWDRKVKINDKIRILDPNIIPKWVDLDTLWKELFQYNSDGSALPKAVQVLSRLNEIAGELVDGGRIMRLWLKLRKIVSSGKPVTQSLATQTRRWPEGRRRWERGLGQDRVNMGSQHPGYHKAHREATNHLAKLFEKSNLEYTELKYRK